MAWHGAEASSQGEATGPARTQQRPALEECIDAMTKAYEARFEGNGMPETDMAEPSPEPFISNSDRLLQHLKPETLAAQLVQAHKDADDPLKGLKQVLMERLELVRQGLGGVKI